MIYLNFRSNGSKLESVTRKFNKNRTPSQVFFKEFHYKCRTSVLKIASWWLLLGTTFFWKFFWMAASQRQLQKYTCLRNSKLHIFCISYCDVMLKRNEFSWIFFRWRFLRNSKHTEIALNIIQKQYFSSKNPLFFHYNRIATPWMSKKLFLEFSFFKGTLRP